MPEVVADPKGCGQVFGNAGGSMSLQCFVTGSLAREEVKDKFGYDWDQFTAALDNTPVGNDGKIMVPSSTRDQPTYGSRCTHPQW